MLLSKFEIIVLFVAAVGQGKKTPRSLSLTDPPKFEKKNKNW